MTGERRHCVARPLKIKGVPVMKTIICALIALAVLSGISATANAFDAKSFYEELDRTRT